MSEAEIAKNLIADRPSLASPDNKQELLEAIREATDRDQFIKTFDDKEIALLEMLTTHE